MTYNYFEEVKADVVEAIKEHMEYNGIDCIDDVDDGALLDELFISDSVTGNASGSYTFNSWKAEEYLCHNMDLLKDAVSEFGDDISNVIERGAETCDVIIRCHVLYQVFQEALEEVEDEATIERIKAYNKL